jgi:hypothetical protein
VRNFCIFLFIAYMICFQGVFGKTEHVTIFVHGTLPPFENFESLLNKYVYNESFLSGDVYDNYVNSVNKIRQSQYKIRQSHYEMIPMLDVGLKKISWNPINATRGGQLSQQKARRPAYCYIVSAYDLMVQNLQKDSNKSNTYVLFGWSGMLSRSERKEAGYDFYNALCQLKDKYYKQGINIKIDIVAWSHGGNVALWLAGAEETNKLGLEIEHLILWGTPMQIETKQFISSKIFKSIISFASQGDWVQNLDILSTVGTSFSLMQDVIDLEQIVSENPDLLRVDVNLVFNNKTGEIGHFDMFTLIGLGIEMRKFFGGLPLVIMSPIFIDQIHKKFNESKNTYFLAHIKCTEDLLQTCVLPVCESQIYKKCDFSKNLFQTLVVAKADLERGKIVKRLRKVVF